jgi:6-phospho-3-hexuloisomerase
MKLSELTDNILMELGSILHQVNDEDTEKFVNGILSTNRIFLTGIGRSGLVIRTFAMRLMQLGFHIYIVGDTTTPAIGSSDLLITISGSGETGITHHIVTRAKNFGAKIFLLTIRAKSSIGNISDLIITLPDSAQPILPLKSAFESSAHIFLEAVIIMIIEKIGITQKEMMDKHSNLE